MDMVNRYRVSTTDVNRVNMVKARSDYKNVLRRCKFEFDREKTTKFITSKNKNAKQY